jgi:hypothetical protein
MAPVANGITSVQRTQPGLVEVDLVVGGMPHHLLIRGDQLVCDTHSSDFMAWIQADSACRTRWPQAWEQYLHSLGRVVQDRSLLASKKWAQVLQWATEDYAQNLQDVPPDALLIGSPLQQSIYLHRCGHPTSDRTPCAHLTHDPRGCPQHRR